MCDCRQDDNRTSRRLVMDAATFTPAKMIVGAAGRHPAKSAACQRISRLVPANREVNVT